jgi:hypothetical protein
MAESTSLIQILANTKAWIYAPNRLNILYHEAPPHNAFKVPNKKLHTTQMRKRECLNGKQEPGSSQSGMLIPKERREQN